jgi:hypothetical protein
MFPLWFLNLESRAARRGDIRFSTIDLQSEIESFEKRKAAANSISIVKRSGSIII